MRKLNKYAKCHISVFITIKDTPYVANHQWSIVGDSDSKKINAVSVSHSNIGDCHSWTTLPKGWAVSIVQGYIKCLQCT